MDPELRKYLDADTQLGSEIAHLTNSLEDVQRQRKRALGTTRRGTSWPEFIVFFIIMGLLLSSLVVHMGELLGWWDPNELLVGLDQGLAALNAYESEITPLVYAARALAWLGTTIFYIFFALPYQLLTIITELLSMVLPAAKQFLPYVEGAVIGFILIQILKDSPLVLGPARGLKAMGNKEVAACDKRIRELKQEIKAKEAEQKRLPRDKVMAAYQAELQERKQREAEEWRRKEEAEREQREREARLERERKEEEERQERERKEQALEEARKHSAEKTRELEVKRRVKELYWDDSGGVHVTTGPDMLILSGDEDCSKELARVLRQFCPDDREIIELGQLGRAKERLRSGRELSVILLVSDDLSEEQLYRFFINDFAMHGVVVLRVEDYAWVNDEGEHPKQEYRYDDEGRINIWSLAVNQLDINGLTMIYLLSRLASTKWNGDGPLPLGDEVVRRFTRYRAAARSASQGWHIEERTLVIDGPVKSIDGRAPWADRRLSFTRVVLTAPTAFVSYESERSAFYPRRRTEGLFEGCAKLRDVDLSKLSTSFRYYEGISDSFNDCPRLSEVHIPDCEPLAFGLVNQGFWQDDDGVWRRILLPEARETSAYRGKHAGPAQG